MPFGPDVITLVTYTDGAVGELGTAAQVPHYVEAPGCHHQPLTFQETAELAFDVATEFWKSTIPIGEYSEELRESVLALQPDSEIEVAGVRYSVVGGVRPFKDFTGWFKATIMSKRHIG